MKSHPEHGGTPEAAHYVLAFESTHAAMTASRALEEEGRAFAVVPTPRGISAGCGMSLRFWAVCPQEAASLAAGIGCARGLAALYVDGEGGCKLLEKL